MSLLTARCTILLSRIQNAFVIDKQAQVDIHTLIHMHISVYMYIILRGIMPYANLYIHTYIFTYKSAHYSMGVLCRLWCHNPYVCIYWYLCMYVGVCLCLDIHNPVSFCIFHHFIHIWFGVNTIILLNYK